MQFGSVRYKNINLANQNLYTLPCRGIWQSRGVGLICISLVESAII